MNAGVNTYGYVSNNPINDFDINGLCGYNMACWYNVGHRFGTAMALYQSLIAAQQARQRAGMCREFGYCGLQRPFPNNPNQYSDSDDNVIPFPNNGTKPWWDDSDECGTEDEPDKGCEALRQSVWNTCASQTGKKRLLCYQEAEALYQQCMEEK